MKEVREAIDAMRAEAPLRIVTNMLRHGFVQADKVAERSDIVRPEKIRAAIPAFYAYCMEEVPEGTNEYWPWGSIPAGPRWQRMPNFGKKTLEQLRVLAERNANEA